MSERYQCDACGWDCDTPALADDPLGEAVWTLRVCPDCGEEVYKARHDIIHISAACRLAVRS